MKKNLLLFIVLVVAIFSIHTSAFAYSYGDPNEEKIAEAYKEMVIKLDENPPNFTAAKEIYVTVQEEIDMHMGAEPSKAIMQSFEKKDKEQVIDDMQRTLALNIHRRLTNVDENFKDYDVSKRLLAKAFATYQALSPIVAEKDKELDTQMTNEFNKALESLGNPGLFGVGQKEADYETFKQSKKFIVDSLQKEFKIEEFKVGHFKEKENTKTSENAGKNTEWTDISKVKNWLPILIIAGVLIIGIVYAARRRR
ncbi:hypothetical protein [Bacillus sp. 165]|uniref:hypothetical protein n=1 Tax=Bacillus sp. 165 TaxID=1529117 RepID=UPI001ADD2F1C|nr:hypothetical protein [Bacillus sp. 165]MBO9130566.1 hypothetical protein [Bacillus sp. 165]